MTRRAKKCQHPLSRRERYVWRIGGGDVPTWFDCASFETPDIECCARCGETLSLGPSSDEDERVRIEILAAFLVNPGGFVSVAHKDHHDQEWVDEWFNFKFREDCIGCQAQHLARVIAEHGGV